MSERAVTGAEVERVPFTLASLRTLATILHEEPHRRMPYASAPVTDAADLIDALRARLAEVERERDEARQWVRDLHSGMYINCVYCGHRYGPKETTPESMADVLKSHIEQCPSHPMSALKARAEAAERERDEAESRAWVAEAELVEVSNAAVVSEGQHMRYVEVQIDLTTWRNINALARAAQAGDAGRGGGVGEGPTRTVDKPT